MSEQAETATAQPAENKEAKENGAETGSSKENGSGEPVAETESAAASPPPNEMRAAVLTGFGGLKFVKSLKKPEPTLGEEEVLIRVKACGLNFLDLMVRQGAVDSQKCPFILGCECAGEIEQVGEGVQGFQVGDLVAALPEFRAWAELVAVPSKFVYKLPKGLSPLDAAAITMNFSLAHILLFDLANLTKGKSVLVHSAGGGVGQAVVQLAKTIEDVTVFGVCSKGKHEALKNASVSIDHLLERGNDYSNEVRKISPEGVDIVLDCLCGDECNRGYALLKPLGKYILFGSSNIVTGETKSIFSAARSWWQVDKVSPIKLFDENKTLIGFNMRKLMYQQNGADYIRKAVEKVYSLYVEGKIKPVVDSTWALEDVAEAMQKMHDRKNVGKIVLDPSLEPKPKPATPAKGKGKEEKKKQSSEEKKEEEVKEEKKEELTNGESGGEPDAKTKEGSS